MDKEMLDIVNDLSKKPTTELALQIMELSSENLILEQQCKKLQEELEYTIGIVEHNRIISEKNKEIHQLKDNWNKLKEIAKSRSGLKKQCYNGGLWFEIDDLLDEMQELEGSDK